MELCEKISSGSYDFNRWLYGGYEKDIITMIAGGPGSGKTNFCILALCSQIKKGSKVIFIDTEGGFSVERVKQILGEEYVKFLENVLILSPTSFVEQKKCFERLNQELKEGQVSLVIVDGMSMLYRLEIGDCKEFGEKSVQEVNREIAKQMQSLSEISRKQKIPVIITNQVYSNFLSEEEILSGVRKETNLVGGDLFKYWSKCIIELKKEGNKRTAILLKHRSLPAKEMGFVIKNDGIYRRGFL
jgi:DNA repair protein RadB